MQTDKWQSKVNEDSLDLNGQKSEELPKDLDEILELKQRLPHDLASKDSYVLTQRLHREPTARTKRVQRMHAAYCRSTGLGNHAPNTGYIRKVGENERTHWTIKRPKDKTFTSRN